MLKRVFKQIFNNDATKMVIIVRTDLNMGRGKIASQVAHAAILLYQLSLQTSNKYLKSWLLYGQPKIILKVDSNCEDVMLDIYKKALENKLSACVVHDAGHTQVATGTLTAVGIGPNKSDDIDIITRHLKLL